MDTPFLNTFTALVGLVCLKALYDCFMNLCSERQILNIFNRKTNRYVFSQCLIEQGPISDSVKHLVDLILSDFWSCFNRDRDSIVRKFRKYGKIELDGYSILHLNQNDEEMLTALRVINQLFHRSFQVKLRGKHETNYNIAFSINEYATDQRKKKDRNMLEEEERMEILRTKLDGVSELSVIRVRMGLTAK